MTEADLDLVSQFLDNQKISILNTRAFKENGKFIVTVGSVSTELTRKDIEFKGHKFDLNYGEFAPYLEECNYYLSEVLKYCANEKQELMVKKYIESFQTGSIDAHKDSQRAWVKDLGPSVETNIGWIETYVDPSNMRAYFEGWVAIVNKEQSKKFQGLVKNSKDIIPLLPWTKDMEKDEFLAPDFTMLEVICFATNGCPLGINIPNYDDIREKDGFKNVVLGNSMPSYAMNAVQFATEEQAAILGEQTLRSYEVHVACHELLGHGVGKLHYRDANGGCKTYTDPITKETFESCYEEGDTWTSRFGVISTSFEECRADTCGFYLCTFPQVYTLFGFKDDEVDRLLWVNVMNQMRKGILGLTLFNAETKKWGQAHTQGAFVLAMWLYKNQKSDILKFEIIGDNEDFRIHLNQENLVKEGKELIKEMLVVLQVYKSSGAADRARAWYAEHSAVSDFFLTIREIVITNKKARRLEVNNNLVKYNESCIEPVCYPENFEGVILSYTERHPFNKALYKQVSSCWNEHKASLKV